MLNFVRFLLARVPKRLSTTPVLLMVIAHLIPSATAQFVAFNDHAPGPGTATTTTTWNVLGDSPGSTGPLKNSKTGANLPVILTITRSASGVVGDVNQENPVPGTPVYAAFNGFVDFQGSPNPSLELTAGGLVTYTFTGLDPKRRYSFMGSAVRGNSGYIDRWTLFQIVGADAFTSSHTTNCLTTAKVAAITANQAAINVGVNNTPETGDMVVWENINPGADGTFAVRCEQYTGTVPNGSSAGSKSYGMTGIRLEEFDISLTPARIAAHPQSQTVNEFQPVSFSVTATGNPAPAFQWFKNESPILGATNATFNIASAALSDHGALFKAQVANSISNINYTDVSSNAVLRVIGDTTPPVLTNVTYIGLTKIRLGFTEPLEISSGTNSANYAVSDGVQVSSVEISADGLFVVLNTTPLSPGTAYTVTVNSVRDRATVPNSISANSQIGFSASDYTPIAIGGATNGTVLSVQDGINIQGGGADIGGTTDQFQFGYQAQRGNFDIKARLFEMTADSYAKAGLMVRENLLGNGRFAAALASSAQLGCFFQSRATASANSSVTTPSTLFPAALPWTWLRLRRSGNDFTGYGSFDGKAWQSLGTVSMALPTDVYLGMAITSGKTNVLASAKFREIGPVVDPATFTYVPKREPLGPSTRRTGLVISEIMYHPTARADGKNLEFIEIYNAEPIFVELTGWRIAGGIDFKFPNGFQIQAGQFVVVAADPSAVQNVYGIDRVLGPFEGALSGNQQLQLINHAGALRAEVNYESEPPWPAAADGAGHSLVLLKPSYGEDDARAWGPSQLMGGSPGADDPVIPDPTTSIVINEFLANTGTDGLDFIELYNGSANSVDISGCSLADSLTGNKYRIPDGTRMDARGRISFDRTQLGFGLGSDGETIYLVSSNQTRVLDAVRFGAQEVGVSSGRFPDGGPVIRRLASPTPGQANAAARLEDVVINEIMYKPISQDDDEQYVELFNRSSKPVDLSDWRFVDGIDFTFPSGATIPAGGYVVVAHKLERLLANHPQLNTGNAFGDFSGRLAGNGERLALAKPIQVVSTNNSGLARTNTVHAITSEVSYQAGGRWPELADGGGSSMELIDSRADLLQASNWAASDESQKAPWATYEVTGALNPTGQNTVNQTYVANKLYVVSLGADGADYLVDDIEVLRPGGTNLIANPGFEGTQTGWTFYGTHINSRIEAGIGFGGSTCLHVRAADIGDTAPNSVRGNLGATLSATENITIRAKARWISGWPEILLRVRGNGLELPILLKLPPNLGSPGLPNSRILSNAGPAVSEVTHNPPVPLVNQAVVVSARVTDPDGIASVQLISRVDPSTATTTAPMRDDGTGGDLLAGDGIYSATLAGRTAGSLVAFRVQAQDSAASAANSIFPHDAPVRECLIRWGDVLPFGTFGHYHLWATAASETDITSKPGLDRKHRDCTFVYNNSRVIYNSAYRRKGSPYHNGTGSWSGSFPADDLLMGSVDHVYRSTGNGNAEATAMAGDVSLWIASELGLPYLHSHYVRFIKNGVQQYNIWYDIEVPNRSIARDWFGGGGLDDTLYKIAIWFEFDDSNNGGTGSTVGSQFVKKPQSAPPYKLSAYRWNWQSHPGGRTVNNYSAIFNLISAATATDKLTQLTNLADMEEWMRLFAWERVLGNWDSWSFNVGQNMYIYTPLGERARLLPWDIDFVLGLGDSATTSQLFSAGQDSTIASLFNVPTYRRMMWRAYQDAVNGPMRPDRSDPQFDARRLALLRNNVTGATAPTSLKAYVASRRTFLQTQLRNSDPAAFTIAPQNPTSSNPIATLSGVAPFAVASIEVNGAPYPILWTNLTTWVVRVPLAAGTNVLQVVGKDIRGATMAGTSAQVTINYTGAVAQPQDWVVINEIMYHPVVNDGEFIELHNSHPSVPFDLSGFELRGADFIFPPATFIQPNGYLLVVKDSAVFASIYGATIPVAGEYAGTLQRGGEMLRLVKPGTTGVEDLVADEVRYENDPPWPATANGFGPSLQLIDPQQDTSRSGNWGVTSTNDVNRATPGRANINRAPLDPFPAVWINEVLALNQTGEPDENGEREPWIELYNSGSTPVDLGSLYLSNDPSNPALWQFPAGTTISPGRFLLIWADAQPVGNALHTNFRLNATNTFVSLSRIQRGVPAVIDYVRFTAPSADRSFGSVPDGAPRNRMLLSAPTPGTSNPPAVIPAVFINEWMSSNTGFIADPINGLFEDWIELFNAGSTPADLTGYALTDDANDLNKFRIPPGFTVPPRGFLLVWADEQSSQNPATGLELHANFKLAKSGEPIILSTPLGEIVDSVIFSTQSDNTSSGRYPDGDPDIRTLSVPTPLLANAAPNESAPQFRQVMFNGAQLSLSWTTTPGRNYRIEFKEDLNQPNWTTLGTEMNALGSSLSMNINFGGNPRRFFRVVQVN